jgi:hypothetical protein
MKTKRANKPKQKTPDRVLPDWLPHHDLEQAKPIAEILYNVYAGQSTPSSQIGKLLAGSARGSQLGHLISSAMAYGIINKERGNVFSLSEIGRKIVAPTFAQEAEEGLRKAALNPLIPALVYSDYNGYPLPPEEHFPSVLTERYEVPQSRAVSAAKIILTNAVLAGIAQSTTPGSQPIINVTGDPGSLSDQSLDGAELPASATSSPGGADWSKICFYITPIGDEGSEIRKHADLMLNFLLLPVMKDFGLTVVRADKIERSGLINQQIFDYLVRSKLCVADLSFGNPNAFYELGVRHVCKLPTIQIIRKGDKIPFDVAQGRTITIDVSDVYTVMDRIASGQRELSEHIKGFQQSNFQGSSRDNPVHVYLSDLRVILPK